MATEESRLEERRKLYLELNTIHAAKYNETMSINDYLVRYKEILQQLQRTYKP